MLWRLITQWYTQTFDLLCAPEPFGAISLRAGAFCAQREYHSPR